LSGRRINRRTAPRDPYLSSQGDLSSESEAEIEAHAKNIKVRRCVTFELYIYITNAIREMLIDVLCSP
jgi:hypothetical protein